MVEEEIEREKQLWVLKSDLSTLIKI
jgi:hypothetical protein